VHLSVDVPTARTVGARRSGLVALLVVDAAAMSAAGHRFQRSANGVWLTEHVPPVFIRRIDE
jgi:putative RNA 2'-phosphotransferase